MTSFEIDTTVDECHSVRRIQILGYYLRSVVLFYPTHMHGRVDLVLKEFRPLLTECVWVSLLDVYVES